MTSLTEPKESDMSTIQDTTHRKPAETGASGCCMSDRKPQADEPVGKPVEAVKEPSTEVTGTKKLAPGVAKEGSCGCGS